MGGFYCVAFWEEDGEGLGLVKFCCGGGGGGDEVPRGTAVENE